MVGECFTLACIRAMGGSGSGAPGAGRDTVSDQCLGERGVTADSHSTSIGALDGRARRAGGGGGGWGWGCVGCGGGHRLGHRIAHLRGRVCFGSSRNRIYGAFLMLRTRGRRTVCTVTCATSTTNPSRGPHTAPRRRDGATSER